MRKKGKELKKQLLDLLTAAEDGFEILLATKRYQRVLAHEGLPGIRRIVMERRRRELAARIHALERAGLVRNRRVGDRVRYALTPGGRLRLLKLQMAYAPRLKPAEAIFVAFDFPMSQGGARNAFRHLLKSSGFERVQQSLWRTRRDIRKPMKAFTRLTGCRDWIRLLRTVGE